MVEVSIKYYESARAELLERMRLRENILLLYMSAIATLIGVALGKDDTNYDLLYVIPVIALPVSILVSHHNSLIGSLGYYCAAEIGEELGDKNIQWDISEALLSHSRKATKERFFPYLIIILTPILIPLASPFISQPQCEVSVGLMWYASLFSLMVSSIPIYLSKKDRDRLFELLKERRKDV